MQKTRTALCCFFIIVATTSNAQPVNAYKFIEPNISISYDSNEYRIGKRYVNTFYETEAYDVELVKDSAHHSAIFIEANQPGMPPDRRILDSSILKGLEEVKNEKNDSFVIVQCDSLVKMIQNFSCVGFTGYNKFNRTSTTYISCYNFSENDNTQVKYFSTNNNTLEKDYALLSPFIEGYKNYSREEIEKEDSLVRHKYTVTVKQNHELNAGAYSRPNTYQGSVTINEPLQHTIKEVRLDNGWGKEIFAPENDNSITIFCNDTEKGTITKHGELVLLNAFGKNVKIPFSFTYINQ